MDSNPTRLAFWLLKDINKAIRDFEMIQDGDRIGVALSGGKDGLSLLRLLDWRRRSVSQKYELVACTSLEMGAVQCAPRTHPFWIG